MEHFLFPPLKLGKYKVSSSLVPYSGQQNLMCLCPWVAPVFGVVTGVIYCARQCWYGWLRATTHQISRIQLRSLPLSCLSWERWGVDFHVEVMGNIFTVNMINFIILSRGKQFINQRNFYKQNTDFNILVLTAIGGVSENHN